LNAPNDGSDVIAGGSAFQTFTTVSQQFVIVSEISLRKCMKESVDQGGVCPGELVT